MRTGTLLWALLTARPPARRPPEPPQGAQVAQKEAVLLALCARSFSSGRTIIFTRTKQRAHRLKILFGLCKLPPAGERGARAGEGGPCGGGGPAAGPRGGEGGVKKRREGLESGPRRPGRQECRRACAPPRASRGGDCARGAPASVQTQSDPPASRACPPLLRARALHMQSTLPLDTHSSSAFLGPLPNQDNPRPPPSTHPHTRRELPACPPQASSTAT
jgi:hypothetical protein